MNRYVPRRGVGARDRHRVHSFKKRRRHLRDSAPVKRVRYNGSKPDKYQELIDQLERLDDEGKDNG